MRIESKEVGNKQGKGKSMKPIMTVDEIKAKKSYKYKVKAYGRKDGYIDEISFSKKIEGDELVGFSFDVGCGLGQKNLKRLFKRIRSVYPELKLETY